jgi:hypothetical protein
MIIKKLSLPRRTVLRGMGAAIALPLLDSMVPAMSALAKTPAAPVKRLGFIYLPNGAVMQAWTPSGEGGVLELSPTLGPLAPFRDQTVVYSRLAHGQAEPLGDGNGEHSRASSVWLNGVHPKQTEGADVEAGVTVDQVAASLLGKETPLPSLELAIDLDFLVGNCENGYSCAYMNTVSWRTATTPLPMENNPRVVFERLFGDGGTRDERLAEMRKDRSILDSVTDDLSQIERDLGHGDRARIDQYLDAVRAVERRIQLSEKQGADSVLPENLARPAGIPDSYEDHVKLMFDLVSLAYQADLTRVFTFMVGRELGGRTYPQIGVPDPHHGLSHHRSDPEKLAKLAKINHHHVELFTHFLAQLQETPDGEGSLLDTSIMLYGAGLGDSNDHLHYDLPVLTVGGSTAGMRGGRHLMYPKDTPMTNLFLSVLGKAGLRTEELGDSTGQLEALAGV